MHIPFTLRIKWNTPDAYSGYCSYCGMCLYIMEQGGNWCSLLVCDFCINREHNFDGDCHSPDDEYWDDND